MNEAVRKRVDIHAKTYGWNSARMGREFYDKDGYEVYFFDQDDGFELTVKNPETQERQTVLEVRGDEVDTSSPLYVAILEHVLMNAESICAREL